MNFAILMSSIANHQHADHSAFAITWPKVLSTLRSITAYTMAGQYVAGDHTGVPGYKKPRRRRLPLPRALILQGVFPSGILAFIIDSGRIRTDS